MYHFAHESLCIEDTYLEVEFLGQILYAFYMFYLFKFLLNS